MGCSDHSVPSLSNTAIRSAGERYRGPPAVVTSCTKRMIRSLLMPGFHDGRGSTCACTAVPRRRRATAIARQRAAEPMVTSGTPASVGADAADGELFHHAIEVEGRGLLTGREGLERLHQLLHVGLGGHQDERV